eukprot:TRINITY_DN5329_c0_g1_i2.p2 TRINITY_DN5329_c0_g1~~TRINITY_DN5329_c0_g1_i2.p2  ORF type:complete len:383 (-),score=124.06 TRINITY_DN5329_c0_g1_i2:211-1359(-)
MAYRSMQLSSTLFGVLVLEIKPQMEKLLRLPCDSLIKEIKLTQQLLELFMKYQIPSDLLSYDEEEDAPTTEKVKIVSNHVLSVMEIISAQKLSVLENNIMEARYNQLKPPTRVLELTHLVSPDLLSVEKAKKSSGSVSLGAVPKISPRHMFAKGKRSPSPNFLLEKSVAKQVQRSSPQTHQQSPLQKQPKQQSRPPPPQQQSPPPQQSPPQQQQQQQPSPSQKPKKVEMDYTQIPIMLDAKYATLDPEIKLRPTIITPSNKWTRRYCPSLLSEEKEEILSGEMLETERNKTLDLIDALSRSGTLPLECAYLHVIIASTHCFDDTLTSTVLKQNVNPIEMVERSVLVVASTIFGRPVDKLICPSRVAEVFHHSPQIFGDDGGD